MKGLMNAFAIVLFAALISNTACAFGRKGSAGVHPDAVTSSSLKDGDSTGLAEGCGQQPSPLGMFCRMVEGETASKSIWFIGPPANCDRAACVYIKVFSAQGQPAFGVEIPKGKTRVEVSWKQLLARDTVQLGDRGTWTFNTQIFYKDADGREHETQSQGDIVLRVYKHGYVPLHALEDDPNYAWVWTEDGFLYKVTAGLRAFVKKVQ